MRSMYRSPRRKARAIGAAIRQYCRGLEAPARVRPHGASGQTRSQTLSIPVRVTNDDRTRLIYATCGGPEDAVTEVLDAVPEGWTAAAALHRAR